MKWLLLLFCIAVFISIDAQGKIENNSAAIDTNHSVKKAVVFSYIIPGAGQIYNHIAMPPKKKKAFWKVPLIYAGLGATGYLLLKNNTLQRSLKREYNLREASEFTQTFDSQWEQYDYQGVLTLYDKHLNRRDLFILAFGAVYIIQMVDAAVEAHFVKFDVSEDLSLNLHPTMLSLTNPGLKLTLNFR
jgi:hypothetical protein